MLALFVPVEACRKNCIPAVILICEPDSVIQHHLLGSLWIRAKRDVRGELNQHVNRFCFALLLDPLHMGCAGLLEVKRAVHEGRNIADLAGRSHRVEAFPVLLCFAEIYLGQRLLSYRTCPALCHFEPLIFQGYGAFWKKG